MENNIIRIVLLVLLFFLLTSDYTSFLKQLIFEDVNDSVKQHGGGAVREKNDEESKNTSNEHIRREGSILEEFLEDSDHYSSVDQKTVNRNRIINAIKNSCLPKLICELNASENKENLSSSEIGLLNLIRDTSISATAEVTSKYHFAAHMGQLIAGIEGTGCHNFYPDCPIQGFRISSQVKIVKSAV